MKLVFFIAFFLVIQSYSQNYTGAWSYYEPDIPDLCASSLRLRSIQNSCPKKLDKFAARMSKTIDPIKESLKIYYGAICEQAERHRYKDRDCGKYKIITKIECKHGFTYFPISLKTFFTGDCTSGFRVTSQKLRTRHYDDVPH